MYNESSNLSMKIVQGKRRTQLFLQTDSAIYLRSANLKHFVEGEQHVTRLYKYSVLIFMQKGTLRFRENGIEVELCEGEYYIQRAGLLQEGLPIVDAPTYFYVEFSGGQFSDSAYGIPLRGKFRNQKLQPLMDAIAQSYKLHTANPFLLNSYMYRIFSELAESTAAYSNTADFLTVVRRYIASEYSSQITVQGLAKKFGYHEDYLARMFRAKYGVSIYQWLISVRIEHAAWLIRNTGMKLSDIATSVGYRDQSTFYRAFERLNGISPKAYREQMNDHD